MEQTEKRFVSGRQMNLRKGMRGLGLLQSAHTYGQSETSTKGIIMGVVMYVETLKEMSQNS